MTENAEKRLVCCVPGCRHFTRKHPEFVEWICAEHWRTVPQVTRRRHQDLVRRCERDDSLRLISGAERGRNWLACKEAAIERAAGL